MHCLYFLPASVVAYCSSWQTISAVDVVFPLELPQDASHGDPGDTWRADVAVVRAKAAATAALSETVTIVG